MIRYQILSEPTADNFGPRLSQTHALLNIREMLNFPGAIAKFFCMHTHPVQ